MWAGEEEEDTGLATLILEIPIRYHRSHGLTATHSLIEAEASIRTCTNMRKHARGHVIFT